MAMAALRRDPVRLVGVAAVVAGTAFAFAVQALGPVGVPLFDGAPVV